MKLISCFLLLFIFGHDLHAATLESVQKMLTVLNLSESDSDRLKRLEKENKEKLKTIAKAMLARQKEPSEEGKAFIKSSLQKMHMQIMELAKKVPNPRIELEKELALKLTQGEVDELILFYTKGNKKLYEEMQQYRLREMSEAIVLMYDNQFQKFLGDIMISSINEELAIKK